MTAWEAEALALQQQADELWRKSQEVAARRLVEQQKRQADEQREKALALQELNDRVLLHHRQRMAAWELRSKAVGFLQAVKIKKWKTSQPKVHKNISHSAPIKLRKKVVERVIAKAPRKKDFSRRTRESNNAICRGSLYRRCYY
jgi:hypothetical protein